MWKKLVGRRAHPEASPRRSRGCALQQLSHAELGLFSADTWTAIALYVRNLILNWIVVLPALCLLLLAVKALAAGLFWLSDVGRPATIALCGGRACRDDLGTALPAAQPAERAPTTGRRPQARAADDARGQPIRDDPHRRECRHGAGSRDRRLCQALPLPRAVAAALLLALYLTGRQIRDPDMDHLGLTALACLGMGVASTRWPGWWRGRRGRPEQRGSYWFRDFVGWAVAGAFYGVIIGVGVHVFANYQSWLLIGNVLHGTPQAALLPDGLRSTACRGSSPPN